MEFFIKENKNDRILTGGLLAKGLGALFLGNLYDNVKRPKLLTIIILLLLSVVVIAVIYYIMINLL
jgi:hypothetical protein